MIVEAVFHQGQVKRTERATIGSASELVAFVRRQGIQHQADDVTAALLRGVSPVEAGWVTFTMHQFISGGEHIDHRAWGHTFNSVLGCWVDTLNQPCDCPPGGDW